MLQSQVRFYTHEIAFLRLSYHSSNWEWHFSFTELAPTLTM